jgi:hypothetical protein
MSPKFAATQGAPRIRVLRPTSWPNEALSRMRYRSQTCLR